MNKVSIIFTVFCLYRRNIIIQSYSLLRSYDNFHFLEKGQPVSRKVSMVLVERILEIRNVPFHEVVFVIFL